MSLKTKILTPVALSLGLGALSATAYAAPEFEADRWRERRKPKAERFVDREDIYDDRFDQRWHSRMPVAGPIDFNRDGFVTRDELWAHHRREARETVRRIDLDRDGWLSPFELRRDGRDGFGVRVKDLDRDGRVTLPEARAARRGFREGIPARRLFFVELQEARMAFARLDRNRDGVLGPWEVRALYADLGLGFGLENPAGGWGPRGRWLPPRG